MLFMLRFVTWWQFCHAMTSVLNLSLVSVNLTPLYSLILLSIKYSYSMQRSDKDCIALQKRGMQADNVSGQRIYAGPLNWFESFNAYLDVSISYLHSVLRDISIMCGLCTQVINWVSLLKYSGWWQLLLLFSWREDIVSPLTWYICS